MSAAERIASDESKPWIERIRAEAELIEQQKGISKEKRRIYELTRQRKEIADIFDSFDYMLREKLEQADHILARIDYEAACFNVAPHIRREYVFNRLIQMIGEIADKREGKRNAL
ncbi:hypothetical protein D3C76_222160 [compost metagenome]